MSSFASNDLFLVSLLHGKRKRQPADDQGDSECNAVVAPACPLAPTHSVKRARIKWLQEQFPAPARSRFVAAVVENRQCRRETITKARSEPARVWMCRILEDAVPTAERVERQLLAEQQRQQQQQQLEWERVDLAARREQFEILAAYLRTAPDPASLPLWWTSQDHRHLLTSGWELARFKKSQLENLVTDDDDMLRFGVCQLHVLCAMYSFVLVKRASELLSGWNLAEMSLFQDLLAARDSDSWCWLSGIVKRICDCLREAVKEREQAAAALAEQRERNAAAAAALAKQQEKQAADLRAKQQWEEENTARRRRVEQEREEALAACRRAKEEMREAAIRELDQQVKEASTALAQQHQMEIDTAAVSPAAAPVSASFPAPAADVSPAPIFPTKEEKPAPSPPSAYALPAQRWTDRMADAPSDDELDDEKPAKPVDDVDEMADVSSQNVLVDADLDALTDAMAGATHGLATRRRVLVIDPVPEPESESEEDETGELEEGEIEQPEPEYEAEFEDESEDEAKEEVGLFTQSDTAHNTFKRVANEHIEDAEGDDDGMEDDEEKAGPALQFSDDEDR